MPLRVRLLVVAFLGVAGVAAWWMWKHNDRTAPGLTLYGNVDIREVELAFRQPGRLETLAVDEGAAVQRGERLGELDDRPYRESLAVAEAECDRAAAELEKLRRGSRPQEIQRAAAGVDLFQAMESRLAAELRRQIGLLPQGFTTQQKLDEAESTYAEAAAGLAIARQDHSLQLEGPRQEDIRAAEAALAAAQARRDQARTALEDTLLVAPADGVILSRILEPGSMVNSLTPVYTLSLADPVYVRAYVAEPQLGLVAPGTPVQVTTDSAERVYEGRVGFVAPRSEFTPKSVETTALRTDLVYRLRIVISKADSRLRQGMPVTIRVPSTVAGTAAGS